MEIAQTPQSGWLDALRAHARGHMLAALGLGLSALAVVALLGQSLLQIATGEARAVLRFALIGGAAGFAATALGAAPALFLRDIPQRVEDSMLGMAAGMMLDYVKRKDLGDRLRQAIDDVLNKDNVRTGDLGGKATTDQYAKALIARIKG